MSEHNPYTPPEADVEYDDAGPGQLAGRGRRLAGSIIDGILMFVVIFPLMFVTGFWARAMEEQTTNFDMALTFVIGMAAFLAIQGYFLATSGQTVAKKLLGMRIVSVDNDRVPPFGKMIGLRYAPQFVISQIPIIGGIFALVNALFIFNEERRCIHDLIAGTKVVMVE